METALRGLKVLDLSRGVAGPYCTRLLAGLGADVLKVEPPEGDEARDCGPYPPSGPHREKSALFLFLNQGKQGVTLEFESEAERQRLRGLVRLADVLVESFEPRRAARLGLSYSDLRRINPNLIMTSVTAFGQDGPYRDYAATELISCAMGGLLSLTGEPERPPLLPYGWQASYLSGASAAVGTLLALRYRDRTGLGQHVDVSAVETVASILEGAVAAAAAGEPVRERRGNRRGHDYPLLLLPCRDGHVVVAIASEADWEAFTYLVGDDQLRLPHFATAAARQRHAGELEAILTSLLANIGRADFFSEAQSWRFPCCAVLRPEELFDDPHLQARGFFESHDHPIAGRLRYPGAPFRMAASPWQKGRAPLLGEHNDLDLAAWGALGGADAICGTWGRTVAGPLPEAQPPRALGGLRVLDLTSMWAGPFCTRLLADAGADVIKIELAARPDGTRRGATVSAEANSLTGESSAFFAELNRNKYGVTLDLRRQRDRRLFRALLERSDVLVENFSARVMPNLGFEYATVRAANPRIIMLSMPAFGGGGPYEQAVAFGSGIEAMAGLAALNGYDGEAPMLQGVAYGDPVAGLHGAVAVLAALRQRMTTGEGQHIELAQREALTQFLGEALVGLDLGASPPSGQGNRSPYTAPHGCYRCDGHDRWVAITVTSDQQWLGLCEAIGRPGLAVEERFACSAHRLANRAALDVIVEEWTRGRQREDVVRILQAAGVPAAPVLDPLDLLADRNLAAREFFVRNGPADDARFRLPGSLCRLSLSPLEVRMPAPRLGEHNVLFFGSAEAAPERAELGDP